MSSRLVAEWSAAHLISSSDPLARVRPVVTRGLHPISAFSPFPFSSPLRNPHPSPSVRSFVPIAATADAAAGAEGLTGPVAAAAGILTRVAAAFRPNPV
ncbi:unnamed protein product [Urochloa humidicola]